METALPSVVGWPHQCVCDSYLLPLLLWDGSVGHGSPAWSSHTRTYALQPASYYTHSHAPNTVGTPYNRHLGGTPIGALGGGWPLMVLGTVHCGEVCHCVPQKCLTGDPLSSQSLLDSQPIAPPTDKTQIG